MLLVSVILLWPLYLSAAASEGEVMYTENQGTPAMKPCLVIIGASYAGAWKITELLGCAVINKGIDGNQSFEMQQRFERDVVSYKPDYVLIWGFINDIFRSDPDKLDAARTRIRQSFESMLAAAEQNGIKPIVATEVTIRQQAGLKNKLMGVVGRLMGKTSYQDFINGHVREMNAWLRSYAASRDIPVLDLEGLLSDSDGSRKAIFATVDGSHITPAAYQAITLYARKQLEQAKALE